MTNEKGLFTVSEDEKLTEEIISVAEGEEYTQEAHSPVMLVPGGGAGPGPMAGPGPAGSCPMAESKKDEESNDWRVSKKPKHFIVFLTNEMNRLPQPSSILGNRSMMEKALGQYKKLDSYISNAMHSDYDDEIDVEKVDKIRAVLEKARDEVEDALEGLSHMMKQKKKMRRRRADDTHEGELVREAGVPQFQLVVTPFQRAIAGALINGKVSGGRNLEELWKEAKEKYKMDDREELEILQVLADMGYPEFRDRLRLGEDNDPTRTEGFGEWQSQYYA
jgi:hypothetical protein